MVEEAKALAAFIREGGVYAALAIETLVILWQQRRNHQLTELVLATKEGWRLAIESEKDKTLKHVMEIAPLAKEMVGLSLDWRAALEGGGPSRAKSVRKNPGKAHRSERPDNPGGDEAPPTGAPPSGGRPVGG